ncbi:MAG: DNA polymerase III subunit chi [Syntrophobacter sp.]
MPLYFVETAVSEQKKLLCQWAERLYGEGRRVQIVVDSTPSARFIDEMLWTFAQGSFVPHAVFSPGKEGGQDEPVLITVEQKRIEDRDTLLCDTPASIEFMLLFDTAVHFVLRDDPARREQSRSFWQKARESGARPIHVPYEHTA